MVYIDGFNLYNGLKSADYFARKNRTQGWKHLYWIDPGQLARRLVPEHCQFAGCRYFTARVRGAQKDDAPEQAFEREAKRARQSIYLDAITALGTQLIEGFYSAKPATCHTCQASWVSFEEKLTDVRIAVQLLIDALHDRMDTCVPVSADADIRPPLDALAAEYPRIRRVVVCPPARGSKSLRAAAHYFKLTREVLETCQMDDVVIDAQGYELHRPQGWRQ